ncbi:hypothetical protein ACQEU6_04425 [Spirillospora sp. CA-108201]
MRRKTKPALADAHLATAWQAASLLLGYPDEELMGRRPLLRRAAGSLPPSVAEPLTGRTEDAVARLVAEGPPEEEVGLAPYGADATAMGPVFLPDPVLGARS